MWSRPSRTWPTPKAGSFSSIRLAPVAALLLAAAGFLWPASGRAATPEEWLARADALRLAEDPGWLVLLHCTPSLHGRRSQINDPAFFLAPDGRRDPRAELHATLRALLTPPRPGEVPAADRFPARLEWLRERLQIPAAELPVPACRDVEAVLEQIQPEGVLLVFPSAYMNSPASLFGHTLLTVRSQFNSPLLNHAVSYAAESHDTNGILFAFKGVLGRYPGRYAIVPYYAKIQEYNEISQRDLWEYELSLTPAEVRRLVLHVWELRELAPSYWFFDENCAYCLLFLLDAARPGLDLHRRTLPWVIPLDTVRVVQAAGLVRRVHYRPSKATQLLYHASRLSAAEQALAQAVARGTLPASEVSRQPWPPARQAMVLELATEELQLEHARGELSREDYTPRYLAVLRARSALKIPPAPEQEVPRPPQPDLGHPSMRFTLGGGWEQGRAFGQFAWRPAYHDELDPPSGYLAGSQIEFLHVLLRQYEGDGQPRLQRLDGIRVQSLAPRDRFFQPVSWKLETGLRRDPVGGAGEDVLAGYFSPGGGFAWNCGRGGLVYALLESEAQMAEVPRGWAAGAGASAGYYGQLGPWARLQVAARTLYFPLGEEHRDLEFWVAQRWELGPRQAWGLRFSRRFVYEAAVSSASLDWYLYF